MKSILYSELDTLEWKCITTYFSLRKEEESRQVMVYQCCQLGLIDFTKIEKKLSTFYGQYSRLYRPKQTDWDF